MALVLQSLALAMVLVLQSRALAMAPVPQKLALGMALLAQSLAPMLKSLFSDLLRDRFRDLFCWPTATRAPFTSGPKKSHR